jgi:hypothetical protein
MLNTRVLALGVLADENGVDVIIGSLVSLDRDARTDVGEQVECTTEGEVQGHVALANCRQCLVDR